MSADTESSGAGGPAGVIIAVGEQDWMGAGAKRTDGTTGMERVPLKVWAPAEAGPSKHNSVAKTFLMRIV